MARVVLPPLPQNGNYVDANQLDSIFNALAQSTNSVDSTQLAPGAVASQAGWRSLADYGTPAGYVPGSGGDDTASWNAWIAALPAVGGYGIIPPAPSGAYNFGGTIQINFKANLKIVGPNAPTNVAGYATNGGVLKFSNPTADCLQLINSRLDISYVQIERTGTPTGGFSVLLNGCINSTFRSIGTTNAWDCWGIGPQASSGMASIQGANQWIRECFGNSTNPNGGFAVVNSQQGPIITDCVSGPSGASAQAGSNGSFLRFDPAVSIDTVLCHNNTGYGYAHFLWMKPAAGINQYDNFLFDNVMDGMTAEFYYIDASASGSSAEFETARNYLGAAFPTQSAHGVYVKGNVSIKMYDQTIIQPGKCGVYVDQQTGASALDFRNVDVYGAGQVNGGTPIDSWDFGVTSAASNITLINCRSQGNAVSYGIGFGNFVHSNITIRDGNYTGGSVGGVQGFHPSCPYANFRNSFFDNAIGVNNQLGGALPALPTPAVNGSQTNPYPFKLTAYITGGAGVMVSRSGVPIGSTPVQLRLTQGETYSYGAAYTTAPSCVVLGE